jgi:glutamate formiminotransferase
VLQLADAAVRIAVEALEGLDLRSHTATHPRMGVADHISCHPLNDAAALEDAAALAKTIAEKLATGPHELPVYLYGSASDSNKSLADIRRQLGEHSACMTCTSASQQQLRLQHHACSVPACIHLDGQLNFHAPGA